MCEGTGTFQKVFAIFAIAAWSICRFGLFSFVEIMSEATGISVAISTKPANRMAKLAVPLQILFAFLFIPADWSLVSCVLIIHENYNRN